MKLHAIWQSATQQAIFRQLMQAMAYPGRIYELRTQLDEAEAHRGILAVLLDAGTSLADVHELLPSDDWPLLQAQSQPGDEADYILCDGAQAVSIKPHLGELANPERSATVLIKVENLQQGGQTLRLKGPGIRQTMEIQPLGLHPEWWQHRNEWNGAFPLGVDIILTDRHRLMCLPRTTQVEVM